MNALNRDTFPVPFIVTALRGHTHSFAHTLSSMQSFGPCASEQLRSLGLGAP